MNKATATNRLKAAMSKPEEGVTEPPQRRASSFATQVADLALSESASRTVALDDNLTLAEMAAALHTMRETLRNNTAPSVRQARARTGNEYRIELADVRTHNDRFYVVAIVTRTA